MERSTLLLIIAAFLLLGGMLIVLQNEASDPSLGRSVSTSEGTRVEAPGTTVESDRDKTRIQAPGVDITVPKDNDGSR